jgi:hypothetical protein
MKIKSTLSKAVAQQMGTIQGNLTVYANGSLNKILQKLEVSCPTDSELSSIIRVLTNVEKIIIKYKRQIVKFNSIASKLDVVIRSVDTAVKLLRFLPIPTAVAGVGVPIGLTNRYSERLSELSDYLENLNDDKNSIIIILRNSNIDTSKVESTISIIKQKLEVCVSSNKTGTQSSAITQGQITSNDAIGQQVPNDTSKQYVSEDGRQYKIEVVKIQDTELQIPRRFAQAKDLNGVVVLKGELSYSSDETVLVEEIIFRIENQ